MIEAVRQVVLQADTAGRLAGRVRPHVAAVGDALPFVIIDVRESPIQCLDSLEYASFDFTVTVHAADAATAREIAKDIIEEVESQATWTVTEITYDADVVMPELGEAVYRSEIRGIIVANVD